VSTSTPERCDCGRHPATKQNEGKNFGWLEAPGALGEFRLLGLRLRASQRRQARAWVETASCLVSACPSLSAMWLSILRGIPGSFFSTQTKLQSETQPGRRFWRPRTGARCKWPWKVDGGQRAVVVVLVQQTG
jgi:hypothetical protein